MKSAIMVLVLTLTTLTTAETIEIPNINNMDKTNIIVENSKVNVEEQEEKTSVIEVSDETFAQEALESEKTVLVEFIATWCGSCQRAMPIIEEIANENPNIKVVKVDVDKAKLTKAEYEIKSVPTLMIIQNGEIKAKSTKDVKKEDVEKMIAENL